MPKYTAAPTASAGRPSAASCRAPVASAVVAAVVAAVLVLGAFAVFEFPAHHDLAWPLYMAARALDGATLYRDLVEVNPPLIVFLSVPAALVARYTAAWDIAVYRVMVLVVAAGSLAFSARIALRLYADRPITRGTVLIAAAFAFALLDTLQFGQREHIALVLLVPYVLLAACRSAGLAVERRLGLAAGVMAGIGLAFKPHFVIPWLAVEAFIQLTRRRALSDPASAERSGLRRSETAGIVAAAVTYAAAVVVFTPEFFRFALYTAQTYGGYGGTSRWLLITRLPAVRVITAIAVAALLMPPWTGAAARARQALAITSLGFLIAVLAQGKGWAYHWVPAYGFAVIAAAAGLADVSRSAWRSIEARGGRTGTHAQPSAIWAVGVAILSLGAMSPWVARQHRNAERDWARVTHAANRLPELLAVVKELGADGPIAALSLNMQTAFPLVNYAGLPWSLRFPTLWPLPALYPPLPPGTEHYPFRAPDQMPAPEKFLFESVVQDLAASRPTLIIVDRQPRYGLYGFDFLAYFAQDPSFHRLLEEYRPAAAVERYLVLRRTAGRAALTRQTADSAATGTAAAGR